MVKLMIFIEGGGPSRGDRLGRESRIGFQRFLEKAGLARRMPTLVSCGSRSEAFRDFQKALKKGRQAMLLVDSEDAVKAFNKPWLHLKNRTGDQWEKPAKASDDDCHFMVECMESWFLADRKTLASFFGNGFKENALPKQQHPEKVKKKTVYEALKKATKDTKKGVYGKGKHSFKILAQLDPAKVIASCPWAARFVSTVKERMA